MFSILICSVNASYLENLKINISETIGNNYELLAWDNLADPKPISEVYNLLAARAKYPYCCFIHEDIRFKTISWSSILIQAFEQNPDTGMIGIAGAKYKSSSPSGWSTGIPELDFCNIFHQDQNGRTHHLYNNPGNSKFENVANVDGVFMAIRREVWNEYKFNEKILRGFHLYDIDFSFQVSRTWRTAVIFSLDILHFTEGGNFGNEWVEYTLEWHHQNSTKLPQMAEGFSISFNPEKRIAKNWLYRLHKENISWKNKKKWIRVGKTWLDPTAWPFIGLFLFGKYFFKLHTQNRNAENITPEL
jgi:Glycosyltransferase like family